MDRVFVTSQRATMKRRKMDEVGKKKWDQKMEWERNKVLTPFKKESEEMKGKVTFNKFRRREVQKMCEKQETCFKHYISSFSPFLQN